MDAVCKWELIEYMNSCIAVFSGYNQRAVIAFLRVMHRYGIENYRIVAASENDTILHTVYREKVCYIRKHKSICLDEFMTAIFAVRDGCHMQQVLVLPSTEALNRFLLKYRNCLESNDVLFPLVSQALYEAISDKESFWKICLKEGIVVPSLVDANKIHTWPIVAKPRRYYASDGSVLYPEIIKSQNSYKIFVDTGHQNDYFLQEYVKGNSYYLLYYFSKDGTVLRFSQKNCAQQPGGKSILAAVCSNLHETTAIADIYEKLLQKMGYCGLIMIELRKQENQYYMIEANPRLWGPSQLFCDAGVPFFEAFLYDYGFLKKIPIHNIDMEKKYFWSGGTLIPILEDETVTWLGNGKSVFQNQVNAFVQADFYQRDDTIEIYRIEHNES